MHNGSVIRASSVVGSLTMLSRTLGLARDVLMAAVFGTSPTMSAFVIAFRLPNLFRRLFGEGALSAAFVPVFTETLEHDGRPAAWALARKTLTLLAVVLLAIVLVGLGAAELLKHLLHGLTAPSDRATVWLEQARLVLPLFQILFPYMFFICMVALAMGALNALHQFAIPAFTPVLLNLVWIGTLVLVCPLFGSDRAAQVRVVAWGIIAAGLLQLAVQIPALTRRGFTPGLSFAWSDPKVKRVLLLMGPAALGMGVTQVNILIDTALAFFIGKQAPAALFYAERIVYLPLGLFAAAMGTVLLPVLSRHAARAEPERMRNTLNHSLRHLMFLVLPASVGLFVLARPIVRMLFEWRGFTPDSTTLTSVALRFYAPGLVAFSLCKVFVPAFYALQDTRTPVRIGLGVVALNTVLNLTFILTFPPHLKLAGLVLATVLAETVNALILASVFTAKAGSPGWRTIGASLWRVALAAAAMGATAHVVHRGLAQSAFIAGLNTKPGQILTVLLTISLSVAVYLAAALLLRCRELRDMRSAFRRA